MKLKNQYYLELVDNPITLQCPHCNTYTNVTLLSIPDYSSLLRFRPKRVGMGYMCNSCKEPIFLKFEIERYELGSFFIQINKSPTQVEFPKINFEFEFIPEPVKNDFIEALSCYSIGALNGFASMCRRTIQSSASEIGAKGKDKVQKQIIEMKELANIDDETFDIIKQIIIDGHDGAHPHLPSLTKERADIMCELIQDVIYQLYVRKGKLKTASELRHIQIQNNK